MRRNRWVIAVTITLGLALNGALPAQGQTSPLPDVNAALHGSLENALDQWCRWLSGYLYQVPGTDLYTMNPTLGTGTGPYRDIAGNTFAAAAAQYWLGRAAPDEATARPLRGLVKLMLGTHAAVQTIDRPDIQKWGATMSSSDNWHADLFAGAMGMLMLDSLSADQRTQLLAILEWEADKQVEYGISKKHRTWPSLYPNTCAESNAWSAALLQAARAAMPDSNRHADWREAAIQYSLNAICMPADTTSDNVVGGKPLKERVKGANFYPGGILEHHSFFHPGYIAWPLAYEAYAYMLDKSLPEPQRNQDVYLHNWKYVFDRLKQSAFSNGRLVYAAGFDWIAYGYGNTQFMPAALFAAAEFQDSDASAMVHGWLSLVEKQQAIGGGSVQGSRLASFQSHRFNDYAWYEAQEGCVLAQALWLLEHLGGKALPQPAAEREYNARNVGTYHEPDAQLVWHRDEHRFASCSWRSALGGFQAMVQPVGLPHLLKHNYNSMGIIEAPGTAASIKVESFNTGTFEAGGFWSLGRIGRVSKKVVHGRPDNQVYPMVREYQALIVVPDGPAVFIDFCQALDQLWLLRNGALGLRLAADVFTDNEVRLSVNGQDKTYGQHPCRDTWHDLKARSVTIEKLLTIHAIAGDGSFQLLQKRQRPPARDGMLYPFDSYGRDESLLAHELYFGPPGCERPVVISPDEWFRKTVLLFDCRGDLPDVSPPASATDASLIGEFPCMAVRLATCTVAINFAETEQSLELPSGRITLAAQSATIVR